MASSAVALPVGVADAAMMPGTPTSGNGKVLVNYYSQGTYRDNWAGAFKSAKPAGSLKTANAFCIEAGKFISTASGPAKTITDPVLAYVLWKYESTNTANSRAAVSYLVHQRQDVAKSSSSYKRWMEATEKQHPAAVTLAKKYASEAAQLGGGYSTSAKITRDELKGDFTTIGVKSAKGAYLPGIAYTAKITGSALFSNGTKTITGKTGTELKNRGFRATKAGEVTVTVTYADVPATTVVTYSPSDGGQKLLVQAPPVSLTSKASTTFETFSPRIETVASVSGGAGASVHSDKFTVSGGAPSSSLVVSGQLYRHPHATKPTSVASVPAGAVKVGAAQKATIALNKSGNGSATVSGVKADKPGYYTWVVSSPGTSDGYVKAFTSNYGIAAETTFVPWEPAAATTISRVQVLESETGPPSRQVTDTVVVRGGVPGASVPVTAKLYFHGVGRPVQQASVPASAQLLGTKTKNVTLDSAGSGQLVTDPFVIPNDLEGWVTFVVSMPAGAGGVSTAFTSAYGIAAESAQVRILKPQQPEVVTEASTHLAAPGAEVFDTLKVKRNDAELGRFPLDVTATLWGPFTVQPEIGEDIDPATAPRVGSVKALDSITDDGNFPTERLTLPVSDANGWYVWTHEFEGADGQYEGETDLRIYAEEMTLVPWDPKVETQTSAQVAEVGSMLSDTLMVSDAQPGSTVRVESVLYGPLAAFPVGESDAPPAGADVVGRISTNVRIGADGTGAAQTTELELAERGVYVWQESIARTADGSSNPWAGKFGVAEETTLVPWTPSVTTQTSHQLVAVGGKITDSFAVTGLPPRETVDVVTTLWRAGSKDVVLSDEVPQDAVEVGTVTTTVTADATGEVQARTMPFTIDRPGTYVFTETITPREGQLFTAWSSPYGITTEITRAVEVSSQATPHSSMDEEFTDTAIVEGDVPDGAFLVFHLYRQSAGEDVSADELVLTTATVPVDGPGEYVSPEVQAEEHGIHYWVEELWFEDEDTAVHRGAPRLPNETTYVFDVRTKATGVSALAEPFNDTAIVEGDVPNGAYLVFHLYEQAGGEDEAQDVLIGSTEPVEVNGPGEYLSPPLRAEATGVHYWVEELLVPGNDVPLHRGAPRLAEETTLVVEVKTTAQSATPDPVAGQEIWDQVETSGTFPDGSYTQVDLYLAPTGEDLVCGNPIWTSERIQIVAGQDTYLTNRYATKQPGTYSFIERTYTSEGDLIVEGRCGEPSETLVVQPEGQDETEVPPAGGDEAEEPPAGGDETEEPPSGGDDTPSLPVTGTNLLLAGAGLCALIAGGVLVAIARLRRAEG